MLVVFHWSLRDSKSPQVFRNFLSILGYLKKAVFRYHLLFFEFFTPALADGFSLEFDWHLVSSNILDSSQYSGRSQKCRNMDDFLSPLISKFSSLCTNPLVTVPRAIFTTGFAITFMFYSLFFSIPLQGLGTYVDFAFFQFYSVVSRQSIVHNRAGSFFYGRLAEIRWSVCISKSPRSLFILFSRTDFVLCIYHFFVR